MGKTNNLLAAWAGLMGACGVGAAAASAHLAGGEKLSSVALILLVHAAAILALTTRAGSAAMPKIWLASALLLAVGASLFSADVSLSILRGVRLFHLAAPTGGMTMILGWLVACAAGIAATVR
jgi:uncharacterized membrane protein YgdD (TMEM256/DUF423 family)